MQQISGPVMKHYLEDFVVEEVSSKTFDAGPYHVLRLTKRGVTTLQAINALADQVSIPSADVSHSGMKDEDGVTIQYVSLPLEAEFCPSSIPVADGHIEYTSAGRSMRPLQVGDLVGNLFTVVVRNLELELAERVADQDACDLHAINYYDVQRFGVPGGPATTHLIGQALENEDWSLAHEMLAASGTPEAIHAMDHTGPAQRLFAEVIDPRQVAFYLSAASSWRWNGEVSDQVAAADVMHRIAHRRGLAFVFPSSREAAVSAALAGGLERGYDRVTYDRERSKLVRRSICRSVLLSVRLRAESPLVDEAFPGRHKVRLRFMLPSGSYATMAIAHVLHFATFSENHASAQLRNRGSPNH